MAARRGLVPTACRAIGALRTWRPGLSDDARTMRRRQLLLWTPALAVPAAGRAAEDNAPLAAALRRGGVAVLLRHAVTEPGVGDPPGFRAGVCSTQRQLSAQGREQARRIGAWFARHGLQPAAVRSSAWCRCLDTAQLAFGIAQPWPPLDSFFERRDAEPAQTAALRQALAGLAAGRFEVWVTHQVNISALTGQTPAMGEMIVAAGGADGVRVIGRGGVA